MDDPTVWCPSCGAEYRAGSVQCADCRVALVAHRPDRHPSRGRDVVRSQEHDHGSDDADDDDAFGDVEAVGEDALVELGEWPKLQAQILRRRLETAGIPVMIEFSGTASDAIGVLIVPEEHGEFAWAVVNEIDADDEVPDASPHAYVARIEELLSAAAGLLDELRTRLDEIEAGGR